eukprot:TRINITY_DN10909_c0_g1_i1.p1 TRINITY_DN10909_c0_g1~~TRINITY_DN10909_c0_g1_i1.p1  ORF type:complete len:394 (+),score=16.84 TRINITY_DN10909_c0_g1_i1:47-1228(+)
MLNLPKHLKSALNSGECSDFTIFVLDEKGNKIEKKVHKLVIRQCSYFSAMFDLQGKEATDGSVVIDNITIDTLDKVLVYLYTEELPEMTKEQAIEVASAADYLQLAPLKEATINKWKELILAMENTAEIMDAFLAFVTVPLHIKPDSSWRDVMELILAIIHYLPMKMAEQSASFVEFVVNYFGSQLPAFCVTLLSEWVDCNALITKEEMAARKQVVMELADKIDLISLRMRTLANFSCVENLFTPEFMLKTIQSRASWPDESVGGEVTYTITAVANRQIELEYETGYVVLWLKAFKTKKILYRGIMDPSREVFEVLAQPKECIIRVKVQRPNGTFSSWPVDTRIGTALNDLKDYYQKDGKICLKVTISPNPSNNSEQNTNTNHKFEYALNFDD